MEKIGDPFGETRKVGLNLDTFKELLTNVDGLTCERVEKDGDEILWRVVAYGVDKLGYVGAKICDDGMLAIKFYRMAWDSDLIRSAESDKLEMTRSPYIMVSKINGALDDALGNVPATPNKAPVEEILFERNINTTIGDLIRNCKDYLLNRNPVSLSVDGARVNFVSAFLEKPQEDYAPPRAIEIPACFIGPDKTESNRVVVVIGQVRFVVNTPTNLLVSFVCLKPEARYIIQDLVNRMCKVWGVEQATPDKATAIPKNLYWHMTIGETPSGSSAVLPDGQRVTITPDTQATPTEPPANQVATSVADTQSQQARSKNVFKGQPRTQWLVKAISIALFILSVAIALATDVASTTVPEEWKPYAFPLVVVLVVISVLLLLWQAKKTEA